MWSGKVINGAGEAEEVALLACAVAAAVACELHDAGRQVRFAVVPSDERVTVTLCDVDGAVLSLLTPARALEIACGAALL